MSPALRFDTDVAKLEALFAGYEEARRRRGIGSTLYHVTPQQRVDAIEIVLGLNAAAGWRRCGAEGPKTLWRRYLGPLLAETRDSAAAFAAVIEEQGLPGRFDPAFEEPPEEEKESLPPESRPPPPPPPRLSWRDKLRRLHERAYHWRGALIAALVLAAAAFAFSGRYSSKVQEPDGGRGASVPRDAALPEVPRAPSGALNSDALAAYREALAITTAALRERGNDVTPRELAAIFAGETPPIDAPGAFLTAMLKRWPLAPDQPIARSAEGAFALRQFTLAAAALRGGNAGADIEAALAGAGAGRPADDFAAFAAGNAAPGTARVPRQPAWPWWLSLLAFLPLIPAAAWAVARLPRALRAGLRDAGPDARGVPVNVLVDMPGADLAPNRALACRLLRREATPGRRLDGERSIRATLDHAGFLTPVTRRATRAVDYLFLVSRRHSRDHERDRVVRLIDTLARAGLPVSVYDYNPDPRVCVPIVAPTRGGGAGPESEAGRRAPTRLGLRALRELHADARLVLVTDGSELVDYFSRRPLPFVRRALGLWPRRMLLTPVPVADWGEREMNLSKALDARIGRATVEGFRDLVRGLKTDIEQPAHRAALKAAEDEGAARGGRAGGLAERIIAWLEAARSAIVPDGAPGRPEALRFEAPELLSDARPTADEQGRVVSALKAWLGPHGFFWFAACAIYPQLRSDITLSLGLALTRFSRPRPQGVPLYDERLLARLTLLPWFRVGRMPHWLRRAAFDGLQERDRGSARAALDALIAGRPADLGERSGVDLSIWRPDSTGRDVPVDAVMADLLFGDDDLVPVLRGKAFHRVFGGVVRQTVLGSAGWLGLALLWCLGAWWLWPEAAAAPHADGAWWPLIAYAATSLAVGGAVRLAQTLHRRQTFAAEAAKIAAPAARELGEVEPTEGAPPAPAPDDGSGATQAVEAPELEAARLEGVEADAPRPSSPGAERELDEVPRETMRKAQRQRQQQQEQQQ